VLRGEGSPARAVRVGGIEFGSGFVVIAGPCAVEGAEQIELAATAVRAAGAHLLRGGAFKPRTSPYAFQGMGEPGLRLLCEAGRRHGLPVIAEVMESAQIPPMLERVDVLQVGARNMQNFSLLRALGRVRRPVLLKRGLCATVEEWLLAAEYLLDGGNEQVILCERGIRTFAPEVRNTLDLSAVASAKLRTHLPVVVDPSHATGTRDLVIPMSLAAAACGAHVRGRLSSRVAAAPMRRPYRTLKGVGTAMVGLPVFRIPANGAQFPIDGLPRLHACHGL